MTTIKTMSDLPSARISLADIEESKRDAIVKALEVLPDSLATIEVGLVISTIMSAYGLAQETKAMLALNLLQATGTGKMHVIEGNDEDDTMETINAFIESKAAGGASH